MDEFFAWVVDDGDLAQLLGDDKAQFFPDPFFVLCHGGMDGCDRIAVDLDGQPQPFQQRTDSGCQRCLATTQLD